MLILDVHQPPTSSNSQTGWTNQFAVESMWLPACQSSRVALP